jgi:F-type H+/Na+-transporting ATPase subunit alpha
MRVITEYGCQIRGCLKQPESSPVSVIEQVVLLLALGARLFENISLHWLVEAELALTKAVAEVLDEFRTRIRCAENLGDEDRDAILRVAHTAIDSFRAAVSVDAGRWNGKKDVRYYFNAGPG